MPNHYLTFVISAFIASAIPGLAVIGAFTTSLKYGTKKGIYFSIGLILASTFYFIVSAFGLLIIIKEFQFLFSIVKYCGIIYIFYIGIQIFFSKESYEISNDSLDVNKAGSRVLLAGFLVHLVNPKNILFFLVVLPQYINLEKSLLTQFTWLTLGSAIPEFIILIIYVFFAKKFKVILTKDSYVKIFNQLCGLLFLGLSLSMLFFF